jgi:ApeA N-terminal domain 1
MFVVQERGVFWSNEIPIPDKNFAPEASVSGVLTIDDDGRVELELDNILPREVEARLDVEKAIQGFLKDNNKRVLLCNASISGGILFNSHGIRYEKYTAYACLIGSGTLPASNDPLTFSKLVISLEGFEEWLRLGSINVTVEDGRLSAVYETLEDFRYKLADGDVSIEYDINQPPLLGTTKQIKSQGEGSLFVFVL